MSEFQWEQQWCVVLCCTVQCPELQTSPRHPPPPAAQPTSSSRPDRFYYWRENTNQHHQQMISPWASPLTPETAVTPVTIMLSYVRYSWDHLGLLRQKWAAVQRRDSSQVAMVAGEIRLSTAINHSPVSDKWSLLSLSLSLYQSLYVLKSSTRSGDMIRPAGFVKICIFDRWRRTINSKQMQVMIS